MKIILTEYQYKKIILEQENSKKIVAVGDSITVRNGSYIDILGGGKYAEGGKASFQLMGKLDKALEETPDYVVIFVGINNPMSGHGCKGNQVWGDLLIEDLASMYAKVRASGAKVIGVTLMPAMKRWRLKYETCTTNPDHRWCNGLRCGKQNNLELRNPDKMYGKILEVNEWIRSNADIVIDAGGTLSDENGILPNYDSGDGIHPNSATHKWIANKIISKIE